MMSLFNSFDLHFYNFCMIMLFTLFSNFKKSLFLSSKLNMISNITIKEMSMFFYTLKEKNLNKNILLILNSMFVMILLININSILPYTFTFTSQISAMLFLSLTMWVSYLFVYLVKSKKNFMSHLMPTGTPFLLVPFLFLIEMVSNLIRPLTVSVRLVANILAGHLLMILLSKLVMINSATLVTYFMLNSVEFAVAMIQAYIFCTMLVLYYSEIL